MVNVSFLNGLLIAVLLNVGMLNVATPNSATHTSHKSLTVFMHFFKKGLPYYVHFRKKNELSHIFGLKFVLMLVQANSCKLS
jgi:hypothetical protein